MADDLLAGVVAAFTNTLGLIAVISPIGVSSSKIATRSTASSAASTSARARSSWTGRPSPLSRFTDASLFKPTIRRSQAARAAVRTLTWPGCRMSKQPLVKPTLKPCLRHSRSCASRSPRSATIFSSAARKACGRILGAIRPTSRWPCPSCRPKPPPPRSPSAKQFPTQLQSQAPRQARRRRCRRLPRRHGPSPDGPVYG